MIDKNKIMEFITIKIMKQKTKKQKETHTKRKKTGRLAHSHIGGSHRSSLFAGRQFPLVARALSVAENLHTVLPGHGKL